jgi:hypothetical protein
VLPPSPGALLALALLTGNAEAAESSRVPECSASSRVDLEESVEQVPSVCVTPDEPTTFVFGAPLPPGAVVLSDNSSVSFAQGDDFVTIYHYCVRRKQAVGERAASSFGFRSNARVPTEAVGKRLSGRLAR